MGKQFRPSYPLGPTSPIGRLHGQRLFTPRTLEEAFGPGASLPTQSTDRPIDRIVGRVCALIVAVGFGLLALRTWL